MNNQKNNARRMLPFVTEFVKFSAAFATIIAVALITLHVASVAMP
ncbi:MAG: hypothetical protein PHD04_04060 [Candidatus Pacebacteria bacterium]|nr:hypothetical protein [Candidatus Paceibacterota bacterium]